jgi:predicted ABC-type transport system involved in lysophospholipase L1 biosynthesis ATPase subunit
MASDAADERDLLVSISELEKDYSSLRPLRVRSLEVRRGDLIALLGFDRAAAEVLVNLIAGATVPDRGEVRALGQPTTAITDADAWHSLLDRFGIVSERALLLDQMTAEQNVAVPLSLDLHNLAGDLRTKVAALAHETGLAADQLKAIASTLSPLDRLRVRVARAVAIEPELLLAEHPNALVESGDVGAAADVLRAVATARGLALVVFTADAAFAAKVAERVLAWQPASGELTPVSRGWGKWFR